MERAMLRPPGSDGKLLKTRLVRNRHRVPSQITFFPHSASKFLGKFYRRKCVRGGVIIVLGPLKGVKKVAYEVANLAVNGGFPCGQRARVCSGTGFEQSQPDAASRERSGGVDWLAAEPACSQLNGAGPEHAGPEHAISSGPACRSQQGQT